MSVADLFIIMWIVSFYESLTLCSLTISNYADFATHLMRTSWVFHLSVVCICKFLLPCDMLMFFVQDELHFIDGLLDICFTEKNEDVSAER